MSGKKFEMDNERRKKEVDPLPSFAAGWLNPRRSDALFALPASFNLIESNREELHRRYR